MKIVDGNLARTANFCLFTTALIVLSGCVSAVSEQVDAAADVKPEITTAQAQVPPAQDSQQRPHTNYVDPAVSAASRSSSSSHNSGTASPVDEQAAQLNGLTTQPTGISAGSLSIFANSAPNASAIPPIDNVGAGTSPSPMPTGKIAPAVNSVYSTPAQSYYPQAKPVPSSQQQSFNAIRPTANTPANAFFTNPADTQKSGSSRGLTQVAALPSDMASRQAGQMAMTGRTSMTDEFGDTHIDADDSKPAGLMKLASLSGLSRVAPNGLVLQTGQVDVGCFKPELVRRIKQLEAYYRSPVTVTSGYRPPKATTQGSKHYTCEAADVQVNGVSKWELANYLRSLPDRGGVGTYCHTESVHMDLGEPRDWNWRCRRTAKSL